MALRGKLAGHEEALELGGQGLTQADITRAQDGTLLAILTPDDWDKKAKEFIHYGCRVVEIESVDPSILKRDDSVNLAVRAAIMYPTRFLLDPAHAPMTPHRKLAS